MNYLSTATPSEPLTLLVDRIRATSIRLCWEPPLVANTSVTFYSITIRNLNATGDDNIVIRNTTASATFFNVTGLLPGTSYELTVMAVSQGGDIFAVSQPSETVSATTEFSGQYSYMYKVYLKFMGLDLSIDCFICSSFA